MWVRWSPREEEEKSYQLKKISKLLLLNVVDQISFTVFKPATMFTFGVQISRSLNMAGTLPQGRTHLEPHLEWHHFQQCWPGKQLKGGQ